MGARFWTYSRFPHDVLRGAGERSGERSALNGLRETRGVISEQWRAGGGKAGTTSRGGNLGICIWNTITYVGADPSGKELVNGYPPLGEQLVDRHRIVS